VGVLKNILVGCAKNKKIKKVTTSRDKCKRSNVFQRGPCSRVRDIVHVVNERSFLLKIYVRVKELCHILVSDLRQYWNECLSRVGPIARYAGPGPAPGPDD
jgi:hypothetical protein